MNNFDNIPQELRERKQWVNWQPVERNGKVTKVPYGRDGKRASTTDPATWMTFEAARECDLERLGFVFRKDDPFFGVDVDECRDPETGEIAPWAQKIVDELATYTEISPSGTGLHSIGRGTLPPGGRRKGSIEMYNQDRYFCMTGNSHDGSQTTIENRQTEIDKFHADIFPKTENTGAKDPHSTEPPYLSDDEVIAKALAAKNGAAFDRLWLGETDGFPSPSEADLALCRHLAFWCGSDRVQMDRLFRTSGLMRPKWDENRGEKTYAQMTIDKAIDSCTTNCESQSKPTASLEELGAQVESIPVDTSKRELAAKLKPVLLDLAAHTPAEATALVQEMRTRFGFNADEVTSCERTIREHRKAAKNSVGRVSRSEDAPRYRAHSNGLVDIVRSDSTVAFLFLQEDGKLVVRCELEIDDEIFLPPPTNALPHSMQLAEATRVQEEYDHARSLPRGEFERGLIVDLVECFRAISELPSEAYYLFLAIWTLHTYLIDKAQFSAIILLLAVAERGKSRTGYALANLSFRGILTETLNEAFIFRMADALGVSIVFDVVDIWNKLIKKGSEDIILTRFMRGATVPRVNRPDAGPFQDTDFYTVFGPTVVATNYAPNELLDSRAITILMPESTRKFEDDNIAALAAPLKPRLDAFRALHMRTDLPQATKPAKGRLGDITRPLLQIVRLVAPEKEGEFMDVVADQEQQRCVERAETIESALVQALIDLENEVVNGALTVKRITEKVNDNRDPREEVTPERIGRRLKALGFEKTRDGSGTLILWNEKLVAGVREKYQGGAQCIAAHPAQLTLFT